MALVIKPNSHHALKGPLRGQKGRTFILTPDGSKPSGGYTVLASALGLSSLDFGICGANQGDSKYHAEVRIGTASTDCTIQFYQNTMSATNAGTDIGTALGASVTALTTNPVPLYVIGR